MPCQDYTLCEAPCRTTIFQELLFFLKNDSSSQLPYCVRSTRSFIRETAIDFIKLSDDISWLLALLTGQISNLTIFIFMEPNEDNGKQLSYQLSCELDDISSRRKPVASLFPAEFRSVILANGPHNLSKCLRKGSVAKFICSSTDWWVTSLDVRTGSWWSISSSRLSFNTNDSLELSCAREYFRLCWTLRSKRLFKVNNWNMCWWAKFKISVGQFLRTAGYKSTNWSFSGWLC